MATILVTGGNGMLGLVLVGTLIQRGHQVRVASRHASSGELPNGVQAVTADVSSGEGLPGAVVGMEAVVHAASDPLGDPHTVDVAGTRRVVVAAAEAGVRHLLYVSIVGVDVIPYSYYRAKFAAEQVVATGRVPWTVQRLTQFHPFVGYLLNKATVGPVTAVPGSTRLQSIDLADAADCLASDLDAGPTGQAPDRGGPRLEAAAELARQWREARKPGGRVVALPVPGLLGRRLREGAVTCPTGAPPGVEFGDWLQNTAT
jgi:uncharacterized protein YbjT (DUF2867 family)